MEALNIIKKPHIFLFSIFETLFSHLKIEGSFSHLNVFSFILKCNQVLKFENNACHEHDKVFHTLLQSWDVTSIFYSDAS